jgi:hypothetical protein
VSPTSQLSTANPFPTRERYGDAIAAETSPVLKSTTTSLAHTPDERTGEAFTPGQKAALLKMRRSDWSKAVLAHLTAFGQADCVGADYRALAEQKLAINKGSFHVLTDHGRWEADRVASLIARELDMRVIAYSLYPRRGSAAKAVCTCGWSAFRTRAIRSYSGLLHQDANYHLWHVANVPKPTCEASS